MLNAIRRRADRDDEEGFTLIELMVVVLIIGILLAIAIPTFLGARDRANNRSAQSNLRNALTSEKTLFTDNQQYTSSPATTLTAIEPALTWVATNATNGRDVLAVAQNGNSTNSQVVLTARSATGYCFSIADEGITGTVAPGTYYMESSATSASCATPGVALPNAPVAASSRASQTPGVWTAAF